MIKSWIYVYKGIIPQDYLESIPEDRWIMNLEKSSWSMLVMDRGFGKILFDSVIVELKKIDYRYIFLWGLEENLRARKFYEKEGFLMTDD